MVKDKKRNNFVIPVAKPFFTEDDLLAVRETISSGWVTQGPKVQQFEEAFASYVGSPYACATSNCTTGLHLSLLAVGVNPGDVVITVSHSFIATANCVRHCGAEPVFIDIQSADNNLSAQLLECFLKQKCEQRQDSLFYKDVSQLAQGESPLGFFVDHKEDALKRIGRVAAILVVHQLGMPCDMKNILSLARNFKLPLIEDAAYSLGSEISFDQGNTFEKIGKPHGDIACFSFHPRKVLVTGEGGMLTTSNAEIDRRCRLLRHQGMGVSDLERHRSNKVVLERYLFTGYNYRMSDIQASIGIEQLKKLPLMIEKRRRIAQEYHKGLKTISWVELFEEPTDKRYNWAAFPIKILKTASKSRDEIMQYLLDHGISTRPGVMNAHQEAPYQNYQWELPESQKARQTVILLPSYHEIAEDDIQYIIEVMKNA